MRIPPKLKPKNPFLTLQPLYTNPTTGLGFNTTSMELGLEGTYGKKKEWTLKPHIGYNYNAPAGKTALTGGLDASYRGMANPKHTANAVVNLGAGYNANSKLGAVLGWDAGYQFHFGAKNRRKGEIKPGKFAGSLMPYAGGNAEDGLMYGGRGEFEWRPKFGNKAPFTVFGGANVNFAPATGKVKEVEDTATVYQEGDVSGSNSSITPGAWKDNSSENLKFKPTVGAHLGVKIPLHRIAEHLPSFKRNPLPYPEDPLPLQGDTTYAQRLPELSPGGKSLLGTYDETVEEFKARRDEWGKPILKVDPRYINQDIRTDELQEFPWQNKSYIPTEESDDGYALGGTIRTMANGGDPKTTRTLFQPGTYNPNEMIGGMVNLPAATKSAEAPMWVEFANEYEKKNSKQAFIDGKKRNFLKQNKGLNAAAGVNMDNFPEDVAQNFANEYDYKKNNYITKKLGKEKDFNPRNRGEWVAELSPGERKAVENSRYGSKLQPGLWSRSLAGLKNIGSYIDPDLGKIDIPGLTKAEQAEIQNSKLGALETFAPIDIPGLTIANFLKNKGLSTGSNYKELPSGLSGESMSNVSPTDAMAFNPLTYAGIEAIPELAVNAAKLGYKGVKAIPEITAAAGKTYNKVATGNSALPIAWKVEKSLADAEAIKNSRALTDQEAEVLKKYLNTPYSVNSNKEYRKILDNITQTSSADLSQANQPLTRINNYYVSPGANPKLPTKYGQKITYPSQRSWSLGDGATIGFENRGKQRVIIPSKYVKEAEGFHAIDYTDPRLVTDNINRRVEREIFGNVPEGYKVIGKSNEGGFENIIVKPIKKQYGGSLAPNIPTYYQSQGTPIYRDTTALPFAEGGDLDGPGDPMPGKPKLPKLSTNDMTAYIYDTVVKLIEEAKASGKIKEGENLNAMGVTAQILLESGNGKSGLTQKYNNFGGIKANDSYIKRGGKYVGMNASGETVKSKWRIYDTPEEGLRDQISFYLDNPRYRKAGVLTAQSAQEHAQRVQNAGYAGNEKKYARQVMQMANSIPNRIKKADPAKLQTFVTSYAPAQPAVNPIMPVQPMQPIVPIAPPVQPVQPINAASIPIAPQVTPTPAAVTIPGGTVTNSALQAQTAANNAMMTSALNNVANSNINSNVASQQNPSYPITIESDSTEPQGVQYPSYSPEYPQWPGIDIDTDKVYSKSFNLPKMNKPSRWDHQPMFKKGRSTRLAMPVITDIEATQYPSPISKIVQGVTGYNPNYYENTFDEEGNLVQGELERAREEGRPVEFQKGYSSIQDIFNRRAYNKQLEQMQPVMPLEATIEKAGGGFLASGYGSSLDEYYANGGQMDYSMYDVFENGTYYGNGGQMIKRADGSYSQRGLWDNIRAKAGSGKPATKEMLAQERKINTKNYVNGGGIENTELSTNNLLPNTNNTTSSCPPFHIYDTATGQCIPMSEKQKAEHSLQFMQGWSNSPMHNEMLQSSIQKDKPEEDVTSYFNNVAGLRNRATNTDINIIPADSSGVYGYAEPVYLSNLQGGNQNKIYSTNQNTPVNLELYKKELSDKTLDPESRKEYTDFIKRNSNTNNIVGTSTFYTQNRPGEHAYVYPHEFSHLQDIGGNLIPFSDKDLIKSNRDQEFLKGQQDIINNTPEKELYSKLYDFAKSYYPESRQYEADKKMYEENFEKFKKQNPKLNFSNTKDNSMPYNDFINKNSTDAHWSKFLSNEDYIGTHTETRARLNAARMFGKEYDIYDPYTEKLTPEKYKQLLDIFEKQNPDTKDANQLRQLKEVFTDEQIINMMNTISKNNNKNVLDITAQLDNSNLFLKGGPLSRFYPSNIQEY